MCGIAGTIGDEYDVVTAEYVRRMCNTIVHRGPDDEGIYINGRVGLGMRRLSIIDVASGHQPIHNEDKTVWVVFNGEIYNFRELRDDLEQRGHRFYTNTDTEVIVHLYEEAGSDCVLKLRGMFAFALHDTRQRSLLLARDRLGKKPLHYAFCSNRLLFGSEIKCLLEVAPELHQPNAAALLQFFYFGYIPDPYTAFSDIKKLPPGHLLEYRNGDINLRQYWDLPGYGMNAGLSEEQCLEQLEYKLQEAVQMRLISDVPLGALLSGGVDSSVIVAMMARCSSRPVKTFSISFSHEDFDESEYARAIARRFSTEHQELVIEPQIENTLQLLTRTMEEPFGDSSMIPTYHVCRMARQHVTVALSGDGGDELFAGYDRYAVSHSRRHFDLLPAWIGQLYRERVHRRLPSNVWGHRFAWNVSLPLPDRYLDNTSHLPVLDRECGLLSEEFITWAGKVCPLHQPKQYFGAAPAHDWLSRLLYLDTKTYLPGDILTKVDRMSMANSLEVRAPLLDHVFVEYVASLPIEWKFRSGTRKYIFKRLAERLGIPSRSVHRRKQGFQIPLVHWMRDELKHGLVGILLEPRTLQRGYFDPVSVRALVNEHLSGRRNRTAALWLLLVFELWHRNFLEARQRFSTPIHLPVLVAAGGAPPSRNLTSAAGGKR
jgi:asparagine synthase (glutamine-hydrolysing)